MMLINYMNNCKLISCDVKDYVKIDGSSKRKLELSQTSFFSHKKCFPKFLALFITSSLGNFWLKTGQIGAQINTISTFLSHSQPDNILKGIVH